MPGRNSYGRGLKSSREAGVECGLGNTRTVMGRLIMAAHLNGARFMGVRIFDQSVSNFRYNPRPCFFAASALTVLMKLIVKVFPEVTLKSRLVRKRPTRQLEKNTGPVLSERGHPLLVSGKKGYANARVYRPT